MIEFIKLYLTSAGFFIVGTFILMVFALITLILIDEIRMSNRKFKWRSKNGNDDKSDKR